MTLYHKLLNLFLSQSDDKLQGKKRKQETGGKKDVRAKRSAKTTERVENKVRIFQLNILFAHVTSFRWYNVLSLPKYDSNICREQVRK